MSPKSASIIQLGYWDMRGYGEPIRLLLRHLAIEFDDHRYHFGTKGNYNWNEWLRVKHTIGLDFPNLPYLIDCDLKINQSQAIMRYLGSKYGLQATDLQDHARQQMIEEEIVDLRDRFVKAAYYTQFKCDQDLIVEIESLKRELEHHLSSLEQYINDKLWITGEQLSYVDFIAFEYLDWYRDFVDPDAKVFERFPLMCRYMKRFESLPNLKDYLSSDQYRKARILNPCRVKQFGSRFE